MLPVETITDKLDALLAGHSAVVVTAPPGAGKSTVLPLSVSRGFPEGGRILMLEPRRLAARQVAVRMASLLGEEVGGTVGYRVRFESRVSSRTRIEVITEGILARMLAADPTLDGVDFVIFDEFHERSLASDEALALVRESQRLVRPDLRILIMSATIDADTICRELDAPLLTCEGRMFPVEIRHAQVEADASNCAEMVARTVFRAHSEQEGDILAFLPGEAEIRRCAELLGDSLGSTRIRPLYGMLPFEAQAEAIAPSRPGERKVVLATPIAETSLTIEGVRTVVDSGLCRRMSFNPRNSLGCLETVRISRDMAVQRSGRAGRVAPGVCYRLWTAATEARMEDCRRPEILDADLAQLVLDVSLWGESDCTRLPWITPPPAQAVAAARKLLGMLGAVDGEGRITREGKRIAALPCHPRIARMMVMACDSGNGALAADLAALLEEKDPLPVEGYGTDIYLRIMELRRSRASGRTGRQWGRVARNAEQYRRLVRVPEDNSPEAAAEAGVLLAAAFPERVAKLRPEGCGHYLLASGDLVSVDREDPVSVSEWLVAADASVRKGQEGRVFLSAAVSADELMPLAHPYDRVVWDSRQGGVVARREWRIGILAVRSAEIHDVSREEVLDVICAAAKKEGESMFDFNDSVHEMQRRIAAAAAWHPELGLPDTGTKNVLELAPEWLPMYIGNARTVNELRRLDMCAVVWGLLSYPQQKAVDEIAPSHVTMPSGKSVRLEYRQGAEAPVLRVRLQECFGLTDTPRVDGGGRPVLMELLSPGFKPVQLTSDLASFWSGTYFEVRKELRRRYPKHAWPEDPMNP